MTVPIHDIVQQLLRADAHHAPLPPLTETYPGLTPQDAHAVQLAWMAAPLPLQDPQAAADEAERAVKELKMPTVVIGTNVRGKNLDLPEFWPFFARINELEVPITIHSDGLSPFQTHPAAGDRIGWWERGPFSVDYPVWWMLGHSFEQTNLPASWRKNTA